MVTLATAVICGLVTPIIWARYDRVVLPAWRRTILGIGVAAGCVNLLVFAGWRVALITDQVGQALLGPLGDYVVLPLAAVASTGVVIGKGYARVPLIVLIISGVIIWIPPMVF